MNTRAISVVVPAYNVAAYIERCVASILRQTHANLEVIVVDDCSTDSTALLLDRMAANDPRLIVIHASENVGVHAARALGIRRAQGDYIGFVDSDDWISPDMYSHLLMVAEAENADAVICGAVNASSADVLQGTKVSLRQESVVGDVLGRFCRLKFGTGVLWNKLYRADVVKSHCLRPLERSVDAAEDYIVNFGVFSKAKKVVTIPGSHYFYFLSPDSATRKSSGAESFCRTLRAYVVCLESYGTQSAETIGHIDVLYAHQLRFETYSVSSLSEFSGLAPHLQESLARLARIHPAGIYSLVHTFERPKPAQNTDSPRAAFRRFVAAGRQFARVLVG